ncbi:hypothetical protein BF49_0799 [Bradyrhizobium sp.]|uniref:TniQ family protein n=1 Tax=Bradyrhizobium sp. TaxID=376 RepID=UPI0007C1A31C|nr:TniQ family protein [Bradyrhizobium sp.]CUT09719.1 hypothetical protein BF49_0799 [Bradyrhizobium sp.]
MKSLGKPYSPLPRWVTPEPFEPPHGCLLRLAESNGLAGTQEIRQFTGLNVGAIRTGKDLEQLAAILHSDIEVLLAHATIKKNNARALVGGHVLRPDADFTRLSVRRVCPACLIESSYHRVWWDWSFVSTCPFHACMLADHCSCGNGLSWSDGSVAKCRECTDGDVRTVMIEPAHAKMTAPDQWAIDRYVGANQVRAELLDDVPLGYAVELVRRIGALDLCGYRPNWPQLTSVEDNRNARIRGFELVSSDNVETALEHAYTGYIESTRDPSPSLGRMYGWFYPWFLGNGGARLFNRVGERLFRHAGTKIQVTRRAFSSLTRAGAGSVSPVHRPTISLSEAASIAKVRHGTMRKLLLLEGLIRPEKRKGVPVMVERSVAERITRDIADAFTLMSLEAHLGIRRKALLQIVRHNVIPFWVKGGVKGQHGYLFRRADTTKWLEDLLTGAPTIQVAPAGAVSLTDAPNDCRIPVITLLEAIVRRKILVRGIVGTDRNLRTAFVDIKDVINYRAILRAAKSNNS